jgi:hypothetical protein
VGDVGGGGAAWVWHSLISDMAVRAKKKGASANGVRLVFLLKLSAIFSVAIWVGEMGHSDGSYISSGCYQIGGGMYLWGD